MKENKLAELSAEFAIKIIELVKQLREKRETIVSNQIGRCGTSIGANVHEANYAQSKKDFISKFEIALKECSETSYWLQLLLKTDYISKDCYNEIEGLCSNIRVMLIKSCRTAKGKNR